MKRYKKKQFIRKKIDNERREQVRLEMKIAERTREIRIQNIQIEKQRRLLENKKQKLEQQLWNIANTLRGKMDADDFRDTHRQLVDGVLIPSGWKLIWMLT